LYCIQTKHLLPTSSYVMAFMSLLALYKKGLRISWYQSSKSHQMCRCIWLQHFCWYKPYPMCRTGIALFGANFRSYLTLCRRYSMLLSISQLKIFVTLTLLWYSTFTGNSKSLGNHHSFKVQNLHQLRKESTRHITCRKPGSSNTISL